nr:MAG TPA: hypothetical protein [Caudoviricetes sp.]
MCDRIFTVADLVTRFVKFKSEGFQIRDSCGKLGNIQLCVSFVRCDVPVCADILDNPLALRLLLVHNALSSHLNRFLAIQGNCPPRAGFSLSVARLSGQSTVFPICHHSVTIEFPHNNRRSKKCPN